MSTPKKILYIALTALYLASIVTMFFNIGLGIALWCVALIPSLIVFLYQRNKQTLSEVTRAKMDSEKENSTEPTGAQTAGENGAETGKEA